MKIQVNGQDETLNQGATLADLVAAKGLQGRRIAIEVNEELVPRSEYGRHGLQEGDQVEIVQAIGGG
ncbi:MAG: thiamine biosynthesis protein ThiS [Gammaproteobacteria bacterium RIFOXYA12_FULL_61_12]|nr:MAG: thiamine biosynthesis protein ThiS [Gammaproteobacteria bacterium RIFOXYD12_FULL_61_37]OGT94150.1 MAG: thiamine biosynthesis protein ThiS [Gammaproteobacteria bacterium RIFOXYA12_FULL_61_12]